MQIFNVHWKDGQRFCVIDGHTLYCCYINKLPMYGAEKPRFFEESFSY